MSTIMKLRLTIENQDSLPDGGPLTYTLTGRRGIDIGRDSHLDWVLPDASRVISGKHCEIRFREGGYWLHDVSSNGTYLNGASSRLAEPRRLREGDRLEIGPYLIAVSVSGDDAAGDEPAIPSIGSIRPVQAMPVQDLWGVDEPVAPHTPVTRDRSARPVSDFDFMDSAGDIPVPVEPDPAPKAIWPMPATPASVPSDLDWGLPPAVVSPPVQVAEAFDAPPAAPAQVDAPLPPRVVPPANVDDTARFVALFEKGAGLPPGALKSRPPEELAEEIGRMMLAVTSELKTLMQARAESKGAMRSAKHTSVQALDNNPIPFAPTAEDALRLMLARQGRSYLSGEAAIAKTFAALKAHQMDTFVAMQGALDGLLHELDPTEIEHAAEPDSGIEKLLGARKARLWDLYRTRWQALSVSHPDGLRGAFMSLFTARYDRRAGS